VERPRSGPQGAAVRADRPEGNHGEDVKEYWWYLDAMPSHAWNRWRYHYPQDPFPYADLVARTPAAAGTTPSRSCSTRATSTRTGTGTGSSTGPGLGASHQTGWTGLVADVIRRRHGAVHSLHDILRTLDHGRQP
jgi:hypothetical protein